MPKKLNFLGGQQNYDPKTGEYEPALKGPNGESPSGFKSFKKGDKETEKSSFDEYNGKRTGKSKGKGLGYDPRNREESTKNHNQIIDDINAKYGNNKMSKKEYWDAIDREVDRWNNEQQYWYEHEDTPYDKDVAEQQGQRRKDFADNLDAFEDEIDDAEKELMTSGLDEEEFAEKIDLFKKELEQNYGAIGEDDYNRLKEKLDRLTKPTEEELNKQDAAKQNLEKHLENWQKNSPEGKVLEGKTAEEIKENFDSDYYKIKSPEITNTDAYLTAPVVSALEKAEGRTLENDELRQIVKNMASKNPNAKPEEFEKMLLGYKGGLLESTNDSKEQPIDYNAKRIGKETPKNNKSGNPLLSDEDAQKLMKEGSSRALTEDEKKQLKEYYANQMKKYGL